MWNLSMLSTLTLEVLLERPVPRVAVDTILKNIAVTVFVVGI